MQGKIVDFGLPEIFQLAAGQEKSGELRVERGEISEEKLAKSLYLQVKDSLYHSLRIKEGDYRFEVFAVRPPPWMTAPLRADELLMEGVQFLDESPRIPEKLHSRK